MACDSMIGSPMQRTVWFLRGLTPSTTYHYAITALDTSGNESASSEVVGATTLDPPPKGL